MGKNLAKIFSILFHPLLIPTIGIFILFNSGSVLEYLPLQAKKIILLVVGVSTFILPLTFVPFFIFQRIIKNIQMENNKERIIPFFVTSVLYFFCFYLLNRIGTPQTISIFILAASITVAILFLISFRWKISAHMMGIGGLTGALIAVSFRLNVNLDYFVISAVLASGLIGFSRLKLATHSPQQIYIGWLIGVCTSLIVVSFF